MQTNDRADIIRLCEQASTEQEPARLLSFIRQINDLLEKERSRPNGSARQSTNPNCAQSTVH